MTNISNCDFGYYNSIYDHVYLDEVSMGDFTYIGRGSQICKTRIGKFCSIGPDIKCGLGFHPINTFVSTHPVFYSLLKQSQITFADKSYFNEYKEVEIGNDVWIGANVIIIGGVSIGDGAIIAAGSVITKDVPSYAIVGGIPAKLIKYRFEDNEIKYLEQLKWWDKNTSWIKQNYLRFHDIKILMEKYPIDAY